MLLQDIYTVYNSNSIIIGIILFFTSASLLLYLLQFYILQVNMFINVKLKIPILKNPNHQCPSVEMVYLKSIVVTDEKGIILILCFLYVCSTYKHCTVLYIPCVFIKQVMSYAHCDLSVTMFISGYTNTVVTSQHVSQSYFILKQQKCCRFF